MGLIELFFTIVGGAVLFALCAAGVACAAMAAGFSLKGSFPALVVILAEFVLLLLWPLFYLVRKIRYRGRPMPPVRPDVVIPEWLSVSASIMGISAAFILVVVVSTAGFLNLGLLDYCRCSPSTLCELGVVEFNPVNEKGLALYDITAVDMFDRRWKLRKQGGALWRVDAYLFTVDDWLEPLFGRVNVQRAVRGCNLAYSEESDEGPPVFLRSLEIREKNMFDGIFETVVNFIPGCSVEKIHSNYVKPMEVRRYKICYDGKKLSFSALDDASSGGASSGGASSGGASSGGASPVVTSPGSLCPRGSGPVSSHDVSGSSTMDLSTPD